MSDNLTATQHALAALKANEAELYKRQLAAIRRKFLRCSRCKKNSRLSSWSFIQGMYYVEPFSCTGGDYWLNSRTDSCHIICPKCGHDNYIYTHPDKDRIVELLDKKLNPHSKADAFKSVTTRQK
jgi:ribosomal protein S27AE